MFENYQATTKDFKAVEEGISFVWRKELDFIFQDKNKIEKTLVISYDAKNIYAWVKEKISYQLHKISHQLKIKDEDQWGWRAGLRPKEIMGYLPKKWRGDQFNQPMISGGLFTPFIELQKIKTKKHPLNPYTTYESYLATIVHEFGHIYYNQHKLWWFSDKKENLGCLKTALDLLESKKVNLKKYPLFVPSHNRNLSELFASCVEIKASEIFWPQHLKKLIKENGERIKKLIEQEKNKNLNTQDSVLDENPHDFALVLVTLLLIKYPKEWPRRLLQKTPL